MASSVQHPGNAFRIGTWIEKLAYGCVIVSCIALVVDMLEMTADILGRKFYKPLPGAFEIDEALMVVIVYMAAAYVAIRRGHIQVDILARYLSTRVNKALDVLSSVFGLATFGPIAWVSWSISWQSWLQGEHRMGLVDVPIWPFRILFSLGCTGLALVLGLSAVRDAGRAHSPKS